MLTQLTHRVPVLVKHLLDRKLDATEYLTQGHLKVESIFIQLRFLSQVSSRIAARRNEIKKRREQLFAQLQDELTRHTSIEESIFYPECERIEGLKPQINESYEEHKQVKTLLHEMAGLSVDSEAFEAKLSLLIENVNHHVHEEEEKIFPRVRRELSRSKLERLASQMRSKKKPKKSEEAA